MIGIALSPRAALEKKVEQLDITWPQVDSRSAGDLPMRYGVRSVSTFILIDSQGKILARGSKLDQMETLIESVLKTAKVLKRGAALRNAPFGQTVRRAALVRRKID